MKIKITFDPDGVYGYPKDEIIDGKRLVQDCIETLNEVEDADTIKFLKTSEIEKAVDFVAEMWKLNYDVIPDDKIIRKCPICGKQMTEGYVFGTDCFCSYKCADEFFNERLAWHDKFENIQTPADVAKFFLWIVFEKHINFHPDDSFGEYENMVTGEPTFSPEEASYYDEVMRQCFDICENYDRDIYKLARLVMGMFCYCDCNDTMAKLCLGED